MSVNYDWCGNTPDATEDNPTPRPCGAPIERWSQVWRHTGLRTELDADHKAVPQPPVGPMEEGLFLRADRYATALAAAAAVDERVAVLTELVRTHEWYRSQAESALRMLQEDVQFGRVYDQTGPEPESVSALLCLNTGQVFRARLDAWKVPIGWQRAEANPHHGMTYEWPIPDAGPFIAWRDGWQFDQVLREAQRRNIESDQLHRRLQREKGYRADDRPWGRPNLAEALERVLRGYLERVYEANTKAQAAGQQLAQLRRLLGYLGADDVQQWPHPERADETYEVDVIDLAKVRALLDRADCGGAR